MTDRFSNFADLAEHYAREIATPDYARAFMEQTELAKLSIEHEPSSIEMPDPDTAQAAIEMMLATVFDLFRDTRMEDFASEVAWGIANSFHVVAKRLDDREDAMANRLQEKLREYDPSEVYATDLEDLTMQARPSQRLGRGGGGRKQLKADRRTIRVAVAHPGQEGVHALGGVARGPRHFRLDRPDIGQGGETFHATLPSSAGPDATGAGQVGRKTPVVQGRV